MCISASYELILMKFLERWRVPYGLVGYVLAVSRIRIQDFWIGSYDPVPEIFIVQGGW